MKMMRRIVKMIIQINRIRPSVALPKKFSSSALLVEAERKQKVKLVHCTAQI